MRTIEAALAGIVGPARAALLTQFARFGLIGVVGFLVDTAIVYAGRGALGLYAVRVPSFLVAATVTWWLNRQWTFAGEHDGPAHVQWLRFLAANTVGLVFNVGTYEVLVWASALCRERPILPVAAGAVAGMFFNFSLSRRLVFRRADVVSRPRSPA